MSFLVLANFKSHKTVPEVKDWLKLVSSRSFPKDLEVAVAPSFPHLSLIHSFARSLVLAAQDVSPFPSGSYTGAVNASQLKDLGVKYCLVGHSERRRYFHETPANVAAKVSELLANSLVPIVCVSQADIVPQFAALADDLRAQCFFCYEPPGDIGGTELDDLEDIKKVTAHLATYAPASRLMYGGSVNETNIHTLKTLGLGGTLVATASLEPGEFISVCEAYLHA